MKPANHSNAAQYSITSPDSPHTLTIAHRQSQVERSLTRAHRIRVNSNPTIHLEHDCNCKCMYQREKLKNPPTTNEFESRAHHNYCKTRADMLSHNDQKRPDVHRGGTAHASRQASDTIKSYHGISTTARNPKTQKLVQEWRLSSFRDTKQVLFTSQDY